MASSPAAAGIRISIVISHDNGTTPPGRARWYSEKANYLKVLSGERGTARRLCITPNHEQTIDGLRNVEVRYRRLRKIRRRIGIEKHIRQQMADAAIAVAGVRAVTVIVMAAMAVVAGMQAVTMATVITRAIVMTAVVSRRVRAMMTMSVSATFEGRHHRRRHTVVAELEQQAAAGRGRHVSGRNQRTHRNPGQQDRQTNPGCQ